MNERSRHIFVGNNDPRIAKMAAESIGAFRRTFANTDEWSENLSKKSFSDLWAHPAVNPSVNKKLPVFVTSERLGVYDFAAKCWQPEGHRFKSVILHFL